jgi:hypothetical protein
MLGLVAWGGVHAYGAYLLNHNPLRGLVIGGFTAGFLAFWGLLIYLKWDRLAPRATESTSASPPMTSPAEVGPSAPGKPSAG